MDAEHAGTGRVATDDALARITAAMTELGRATAGDIATRAGVPYSSTTPKLRGLEEQGTAERVKDNGRTFWQLTAAGPDQNATGPGDADEPEPEPGHQVEPGHEEPLPEPAPSSSPADQTDDAATTTVGAVPDGEHHHAADAGTPGGSPAAGTDAEAVEAPPAGAATQPGPEPEREAAVAAAEEGPAPAGPDEPPPAGQGVSKRRGAKRPKGALRASALKVLRDEPQRQFKVGEVSKLIDEADAGKGWSKASPGAVVNDLDKLTGAGLARRTADRPATYQAA